MARNAWPTLEMSADPDYQAISANVDPATRARREAATRAAIGRMAVAYAASHPEDATAVRIADEYRAANPTVR